MNNIISIKTTLIFILNKIEIENIEIIYKRIDENFQKLIDIISKKLLFPKINEKQ